MATNTLAQIERQIRIAKVEECLLRGIKSTSGLAVRFGVCLQTMITDIKTIKAAWTREGTDRTSERRHYRVRQLEYVIQQASNGYVASCQDAQEVTLFVKDVICRECNGLGVGADGDWCVKCEGDGYLKHTDSQIKKRGQAGDPAFLNVALNCLKEISHLEGNAKPRPVTVKIKTPAGAGGGGTVLILDPEKLIQAKCLLAQATAPAGRVTVDASSWAQAVDNAVAEES